MFSEYELKNGKRICICNGLTGVSSIVEQKKGCLIYCDSLLSFKLKDSYETVRQRVVRRSEEAIVLASSDFCKD